MMTARTSMSARLSSIVLGAAVLAIMQAGCGCNDDGPGDTSLVGTYDGLFDNVATGFNFPLDLAIVPDTAGATDGVMAGDIVVASYGTSEVYLVADPGTADPEPLYAGTDDGLQGTTAISIPPDGNVWAAFEQGGEGDAGGIVVLSPAGDVLAVLDRTTDAIAFDRPGGLCYGGQSSDGTARWMFMVNMGDGTAWRIDMSDGAGSEAAFTLIGSGLATGTAGRPGTPGSGITTSGDLPDGGARGCVHHMGSLYVADAQNARVVRFDGVDTGVDLTGTPLEDTPPDLATYPTGVAVNEEGTLLVISYDNAHAFVALYTPSGGFVDNGLFDLNVNAGNHGMALGHDTIWFTRANNSNGALRAVTPTMDDPPTTQGPIIAQ